MKFTRRLLSAALALCLALALALPAFARCKERQSPAQPFDNSSFFEYEGCRIHYRTFPAKNAKDQVFLIHGFALSSYCFVALAEELVQKGYTCVLADLPNFGYSTRETKDSPQLPREEIMHALMCALSDKPWYVGGHSMGGYIALAIATQYPESVKRLLLYGTNGNNGAEDLRGRLMQNETLLSVFGPLMEAAGKTKPLVRLLYAFACNSLRFALQYDIDKITDPYYIKGTGEGALRNFPCLPKTDYAAVRAMPPILFVNGNRDYVVSDSLRKDLRAALPEGSLDYVVKGAGHMVIETHVAQVAELTVDFMETE